MWKSHIITALLHYNMSLPALLSLVQQTPKFVEIDSICLVSSSSLFNWNGHAMIFRFQRLVYFDICFPGDSTRRRFENSQIYDPRLLNIMV